VGKGAVHRADSAKAESEPCNGIAKTELNGDRAVAANQAPAMSHSGGATGQIALSFPPYFGRPISNIEGGFLQYRLTKFLMSVAL
jgi:hypothetical protein